MFLRYSLPSCLGVRAVAALAVLMLPTAMAGPAAAQPSPEEIAAIRQACRSDFISHCSGVQPGGREALQCLERNAAQLSTECSSAVGAVAAPKAETETKPEAQQPAAAAATPPQPSRPSAQDELAAVQQACTIKDFMSHCSWIQPGNPELLLCLRANAAELSPACQNVVRGPAGATPPVAAAPPVTAPPAAPPPPAAIAIPAPAAPPAPPRSAAAPKRPTAKQTSAIRAACRSDFISHCAGVQPGGRDALMCLERNQAEVSPSCQTALAAIGGGATGPGASSPGAPGLGAAIPDAGAPAAPPTDRLLIPRLPLRAEIMILRVCAADHRNLCGDVPPGGGRILGCLARNAPRLMPECRAVLSEIAARGR
jgi:Cysteine rich repeat